MAEGRIERARDLGPRARKIAARVQKRTSGEMTTAAAKVMQRPWMDAYARALPRRRKTRPFGVVNPLAADANERGGRSERVWSADVSEKRASKRDRRPWKGDPRFGASLH